MEMEFCQERDTNLAYAQDRRAHPGEKALPAGRREGEYFAGRPPLLLDD